MSKPDTTPNAEAVAFHIKRALRTADAALDARYGSSVVNGQGNRPPLTAKPPGVPHGGAEMYRRQLVEAVSQALDEFWDAYDRGWEPKQ